MTSLADTVAALRAVAETQAEVIEQLRANLAPHYGFEAIARFSPQEEIVLFAGILFPVEERAEAVDGEDAAGRGEFLCIEQTVNAIGDPGGLEHAEIVQTAVGGSHAGVERTFPTQRSQALDDLGFRHR